MNAATTDPVQDDYDSPWKEAIEHHFPEFMVFLFADIEDLIDCKGHRITHNSFLNAQLTEVQG